MYGCESWTIKKAECQRIGAFNCGVGEDSWESLGLQGDPTSPSLRRSVLSVHWKDWCWSWNSSTLATWCKELTHLKRPWCWERLKVGGEGDDRGWGGWMVSLTQWDMNLSKLWELVMDREAWHAAVHGVAKSQTRLSDWTELNWTEGPGMWPIRHTHLIFQLGIEQCKETESIWGLCSVTRVLFPSPN